MEEQEELIKTELAKGMLELEPYIAPQIQGSVHLVLHSILLTVIHQAYILGGKECLKHLGK